MKKKIVFDMALNIIATAIPVFVLQLLILPVLSRDMSDQAYGLLVTILSMLNIVPATFGNTLHSIRLLHNTEYEQKGYNGDFNVLLLSLTGINLIIVAIFSYFYENTIAPVSLLLTLSVSVAWLFKEYFIVAFRIKINYKAILINNILQAAGYGLGYLFFRATGHWQLIYLTGYIVSLIYIFARCRLWREKLQITPLFKNTAWQDSLLLASGLLNRLLNYVDKILIYPILGGGMVSILYVATLSGKVVSLLIPPMTSVFLTYLAKMTLKRDRRDNMFRRTLLIGVCVCVVAYIVCVLISRPVLGLIYPQYVDDAMNYVLITTGSTVLYTLMSILNAFIMRYFDMKWQIATNGGAVAVYLVVCMTLLHFFGMYGFCVGALLTNLFRVLFMLFIYKRCRTLVD